MSVARTLSRNISWNYAEAGVSLVVYFLLTPIVVRHLGEVGYGLWVLLKAILYWLRFLDLGFYNALVKYVAEHAERREWPTVNGLVATTTSVLFVAGGVALAGSALMAWAIVPTVFHVPADRVAELQLATVLIGVDLFLAFPASVLHAIFEGRQRFDVLSAVAIAASIAGACATVIALGAGYGVVSLVCIEIATTLLGALLFVLALGRVVPEVRLRLGPIRGAHFRRIRGYSTWTSLNEVLVDGSVELEKLVLPALLSVAALTPYTLVCKIASGIFLAVEPITHTFFPLSSAYEAQRDVVRLRTLLIRGTKVVMAVGLPIAVALAAYGQAFLSIWIDDPAVVVPAGVMPVVIVNFLVIAFALTSVSILLAMAKVKDVFLMSATELVLALVLMLALAPRWGLVGVAGSLLAGNAAVALLWTVPLVCRIVQQSVARFLAESALRPLLAAVPMAACIAGLDRWVDGSSLPWMVLKAGIASGVYLAAFYVVSLSAEERLLCSSGARQLLQRGAE